VTDGWAKIAVKTSWTDTAAGGSPRLPSSPQEKNRRGEAGRNHRNGHKFGPRIDALDCRQLKTNPDTTLATEPRGITHMMWVKRLEDGVRWWVPSRSANQRTPLQGVC